MTLYLVEHFAEQGLRSSCVCETFNGAKDMIRNWRKDGDKRASITMLTGFYRVGGKDDIRFVPLCKNFIEDIRFSIEEVNA